MLLQSSVRLFCIFFFSQSSLNGFVLNPFLWSFKAKIPKHCTFCSLKKRLLLELDSEIQRPKKRRRRRKRRERRRVSVSFFDSPLIFLSFLFFFFPNPFYLIFLFDFIFKQQTNIGRKTLIDREKKKKQNKII